MLDGKKDELVEVQKEISEARQMLKELARLKAENSSIVLYNSPNPLKESTTIVYSLPLVYNKAFVVVYDKLGRKLKEVNISGTTKGNIPIDLSKYASGIYNYMLVIDGKLVKSEKMLKAQ